VNRERIRQNGKEALELIEEAVHLLRSAPGKHLMLYYAGTFPFVLAALYFWADMSRSPFAGQHLVPGALGLACLFCWMKTCQALFARRMRYLVSGENATFTPGQVCRMFVTEAALQPTGLFVLPVALVLMLPFGWVFAFYQNLGALNEGKVLDLKATIQKATGHALLWPRQNHSVLVILSGFWLFVCLNLMSGCFVLPALLKMLFGIETVFTRSGLSVLNTTFLAATLALAYLCIDPIVKTIYALRCFYGESQRSGADLKAQLRWATSAPVIGMLLALVALSVGPMDLLAAEGSSTALPRKEFAAGDKPRTETLAPAELDQTIQQVIRQPKYSWRQPRQKLVDEGNERIGFFGKMLERIKPALKNMAKAIGKWLDAFLRRWFSQQRTSPAVGSVDRLATLLHLTLYALIAGAIAGLLWLLYRVWSNRRQPSGSIASEPLQPTPDLSNENLGAEELPEESWIKLGRDLLVQGNLRLAIRAFYLASLAQLASKNLIQLARFKSNRDYERELGRRAHALPGLVTVFSANLQVFDQTWYGMHEITADMVTGFAENVERLRVGGPAPGMSSELT
jgi:hypothetical protein